MNEKKSQGMNLHDSAITPDMHMKMLLSIEYDRKGKRVEKNAESLADRASEVAEVERIRRESEKAAKETAEADANKVVEEKQKAANAWSSN